MREKVRMLSNRRGKVSILFILFNREGRSVFCPIEGGRSVFCPIGGGRSVFCPI